MYDDLILKEDELAHYGRLGMKWYQHLFGNDTRVGKAGRNHKLFEKKSAEDRRTSRAVKAANKAANLQVKRDAKLAKAKASTDYKMARINQKKAIAETKRAAKVAAYQADGYKKLRNKKGEFDTKKVSKVMNLMSDTEVKALVNRMTDERKIADIKHDDIRRGKENVENTFKTMREVGGMTGTAMKVGGSIAGKSNTDTFMKVADVMSQMNAGKKK